MVAIRIIKRASCYRALALRHRRVDAVAVSAIASGSHVKPIRAMCLCLEASACARQQRLISPPLAISAIRGVVCSYTVRSKWASWRTGRSPTLGPVTPARRRRSGAAGLGRKAAGLVVGDDVRRAVPDGGVLQRGDQFLLVSHAHLDISRGPPRATACVAGSPGGEAERPACQALLNACHALCQS